MSPAVAEPSQSADRAFEQYVLPEVDVMLRVARSLTRNAADAEDLVQDSLLRAYRAIDRFDGRHPRAWLLTIVRNTHINRNRRRRPELLRDPDTQLERIADEPDPSIDPERVVELELDAEIVNAFSGLTPQYAEAIELVDVNGLSYAEAADVVGVPVGTIMSRLHRGRRKIREHLRRTGRAPMFVDLEPGGPS